MVIVGGSFELEEGERDAFLAGREEAMRRSRSEPGCLEYVFAPDPLDARRVVLFEIWETEEALAAHGRALRDAPRSEPSVRPVSAEIRRYDVSGVRPLG
ncbi:MAG TPA: putative quinol monooxygenase [Acidimicrobiales bacterium]|nr:putative quinol monooxygenase [Acidimicrobiales bacterium]